MPFRKNRRTKGTFFIAEAIRMPGALTSYVESTFGAGGFTTHDGRRVIKPEIINKIASGKCPVCGGTPKTCVCPTKITRKRAVLARTLRGLGRRGA